MRDSPWVREDAFGSHPAEAGYGYWGRKGATPCDLETLRGVLEKAAPLVWTPGRAGLVHAHEVPELFEVNRRRRLRQARVELNWAMLSVVVWSGLLVSTVSTGDPTRSLNYFGVMLLVLGVMPAIRGGIEWWRAWRWTPERMAREAPLARFRGWADNRRAVATWSVVWGLLVIGAWGLWVQGGRGGGWGAAVLDKARVAQGEWWRLGTGAMLHGHPLHLFFNLLALAGMGRLVEAVYGWRVLLAVLAAGMLGGAGASQVLLAGPSVGFSGAIMALLGFVVGAERGEERVLPAGVTRLLWAGLGMTALIGVVGADFIDNAAHGGGVLAGAGVGQVYRMRAGRAGAEGAGQTAAGWAGGAVLVAAALACGVLLTRG